MGAKGEGGEAAAGAPESADPTQNEIAADAGEQQFENVPVGDEGGEGAKATRYVCARVC